MKKYIIILVLLLSWVLFASPCFAATYYIDYVGGSATAAGTSTGTAWQYTPGDSRFAAACTGNCSTTWTGAGSALNAGDKIIFKGGVTYSGSVIATTWGGSADDAAHRIIYDGDSGTYVTRWGSGTAKAVIDGEATREAWLIPIDGKYITVNSFEIRNGPTAGVGDNTISPYLIFSYSGSTNLTISNNSIHSVGNFTEGSIRGACVVSDGSNYYKFQNNTLYDCAYTGLAFWPRTADGSNLDISGNNLTDRMGWAIAIPVGHEATYTNWKIYNNVIHDLVAYGAYDTPHANYIWIYGDGAMVVDGLEIYNNLLYIDGASAGSSGAIHLEASNGGFNNVKIYNNVIKNIDYFGAIYLTPNNAHGNGTFTDLYIYNNSIFQPSTITGGGIVLFSSATGTYTNVNIKNNIFSIRGAANAYAIALVPSIITGLNIDYNFYYLATATPFDCNGANNWADFKTCTSNPEMHSVGLTSDPLYTDVGATSHDLRLLSTSSPAYNTGVDLSATIGSLDFLGNTRSGAWDIGAYEYVSGGGATTPSMSGCTISGGTVH